ncbi:MAG: 2-amino-4-hydroxy-6-hydroxymethyldihydropteridine diphosphokinase [Acidimicrobiia bacterium]
MAVRAAIALGSNLSDRARHIAQAVGGLAATGALVRVSSLYETAPVGGPKQGKYINAVAVVDTDLSARALLDSCLEIEREHGRERRERWGPRTLDLDILLYGDRVIDEPDLTVPHPRMTERRFVLEPLLEAWPDATLPDGTPLAGFLPAVAGQKVRKLETVIADRRTSLLLFLVVALGALAIWWLGDWLVR